MQGKATTLCYIVIPGRCTAQIGSQLLTLLYNIFKVNPGTLVWADIGFLETSVSKYQSALRNVPDGRRFGLHLGESLKLAAPSYSVAKERIICVMFTSALHC